MRRRLPGVFCAYAPSADSGRPLVPTDILRTPTTMHALPAQPAPQDRTYAVVGVSDDPAKYGHKVFADLIRRAGTVYPIHLDGGEIFGHTRYKLLRDLPIVPDMVITVVPPPVTLDIVKQCIELGVREIWMQPGSESDEAVALAQSHGLRVTTHACMMLPYAA